MKQNNFVLWKFLSVSLFLLAICLSGCEKKQDETAAPPDESSGKDSQVEQTETTEPKPEKESAYTPPSICKLQEVKIADLQLKSPPSFLRRMERQDKEIVKKGTITLDGREYLILLGENPSDQFYIKDIAKDYAPYWWGSWSLHSKHLLDGKYYEFDLIENKTKIAGSPYTGEFGILKLGKGDRTIEKMEMSGSINQAGSVGAPIGKLTGQWPEPVSECSVPVGDYTADLMKIIYGDLRISISNNYYNNINGERSMNSIVYGMKIRKDEPYVLDFSNEPAIVFESPKNSNTEYVRGDEILFSAVLIDPKLDIMIRGLDDTSQHVEKEYKNDKGEVYHTAQIPKSLDPKVIITRSNGEVVGEGTMPFG